MSEIDLTGAHSAGTANHSTASDSTDTDEANGVTGTTRTIEFSVDRAEWTRYFYSIEVDASLDADAIKEAALEAVASCDACDRGTKCLGNVEMIDEQYNWPEGM